MNAAQLILGIAFLYLVGMIILGCYFRISKGPKRWYHCDDCGRYFNLEGEVREDSPEIIVDDWPALCDSCALKYHHQNYRN
jgi:hypothetical protein